MNICQLKIRVAGEKWRPRKQKKIADEAVSFFKADWTRAPAKFLDAQESSASAAWKSPAGRSAQRKK